MKPPKFIDNKDNKMIDEIKEYTKKNSKMSVIAAQFTLFAFEELKKELSNISEFRFIFTEPTFVAKNRAMREFYISKDKNIFGTEFEIKLRNKMQQSAIAKECVNWIKKKAKFKSFKTRNPAYPRLMYIEDEENKIALNGTVDFTADSLGLIPSTRVEAMNAFYGEHTISMLQAFENIWSNEQQLQDVTDMVIENMDVIHKENPPEFIYFITLYNIFYEYLNELTDDRIVKEKTGIKETVIWNKLYQFQKDGVLGAIEKIEKHNGCIIADSVGLGKTFSALAIIKYYELRNDRVLVLCPKKLRDNWVVYTMNDRRNMFVEDRFSYDVLNHTDLSRDGGYSGDINLAMINWENYDLIVIDESHNFRNNPPVKDRKTRYQRLMQDVIKSGVKTKVLMLSATPVNNKMADIKNQIAFIVEDNDEALADIGISSIDNTLRRAQMIFNEWSELSEKYRTTDNFVEMMHMDYFRILDTLTIARSRKHIEKYYDIEEIGEFPERLKPINKYSEIDINGKFPMIEDVNDTINRLNLAIYSPLKYVFNFKLKEYQKKYDIEVKSGQSIFRQRDRENSLIHLMRVNILKRLESSIHSFKLTVKNLLYQVDKTLDSIKAHRESYEDRREFEDISILDIDPDDIEFEDLLIGNKVKVLLNDVDTVKWRQELDEDKKILEKLLHMAEQVEPENDAKLDILKETIIDKLINPINKGNRKILIFTTFIDTAKYLYENLSKHAKSLGINAALVTGSDENRSTLEVPKGYRNQIRFSDINTVLTLFSPKSKEGKKIFPFMDDEIDLLIATDCVSEGQNLQDCDFVINYDIHWNPVRIIQRFGRIDRIGSQNKRIQLVNFWPTKDLDTYINLEQRVKGRMVLADVSATGEENPVSEKQSTEMKDLLYRRKQMERLREEVVDLEDISEGISITDLTFSDFRADLAGYLKHNRKVLEKAPTGLYAIARIDKAVKDDLEPGVIFLLEQVAGKESQLEKNPLHPFYLIYVTDEGKVKLSFTKSKQILDYYKKICYKNDLLDRELIDRFNHITNDAMDMSKYSNLLEIAIENIVGSKEQAGIRSLFTKGGTNILSQDIDGLEDFELISFLVIDS
ncbi:MAG: helicase [Clostridiales bacterium]|nr:helicase [Clostridiales bacterium]